MSISGKVEDLERFEEVVEILFQQGMGRFLDRLDLEDRLPVAKQLTAKRQKKPDPVRARETLEQLGVVFIKFGQMLAEREDLVSEEYAEELQKLEHSVPSFDGERARKIAEKDCGDAFEEFEEEPVASASIAQVHRAKLNSGEEVAVKVRRPGIADQVEEDIQILHFLAERAEKYSSIGNRQLTKDVEKFGSWTRKEMDFQNELRNGKELRKLLEDHENLRVPKIYGELSTSRVLVMEYVDAVRIDDVEKLRDMDLDIKELVQQGLRAQMEGIFKHGFYHGDPHPSNFMVDTSGTLVFLDFGIVGRLSRRMRKEVFLIFYSLTRRDPEGVYSSLLEISEVEDDANLERLKSMIEEETLELSGAKLEQKSIARTFAKISISAIQYGVYPPNDLFVMGKGMTTMEGIGLKLYPEFNFVEQNREFMEGLLKDQLDPRDSAEELTADILRNRELFENMPSKLNQLMEKRDRNIVIRNEGDDNTAPAVLIASSIFLAISLPRRYGIVAGVSGLVLAYLLHRR